ncbi:MAG: hypothetical protein ACFHWX_19210 [Bacteroidota bacterium]
MQKIILSSILSLLMIYASLGQDIPLETWRTHFSYNQIKYMAASANKIFCAADNGFFYYDLEDNSLNKVTKINGLSDVDISALSYNQEADLLVIGYSSGGVDLVKEDGIVTINDFKNSNLASDQAIYDIKFWNDDVLIATSLGIIVISISKNEITENYRSIGTNGTDVSVKHLYVLNDTLFAITNQGIQTGSLNQNLLDFNNWTLFPETQNQKNSFFGVKTNQLYSIKNDTVLTILSNNQWIENGYIFSNVVAGIKEYTDLFFIINNTINRYDGNQWTEEVNMPYQINDFILNDEFWLGTEGIGVVRYQSNIGYNNPEGPISDEITNVVAENGKIYFFYAPDPQFYSGQIEESGYTLFDGKRYFYTGIDDFYNISDVTNWNGKTYFSSIGYGIYIEEDDKIINLQNSILTDSKNSSGPIITDMEASDKLWIASYNNANPIATIDEAGITNFSESVIGTDSPVKIISTSSDLKLIQNSIYDGGGMIAFSPPNTRKSFGTFNGLPSNEINSAVVDIEDVALVGTSQGLITFPDASYLLDFSQPVNLTFDNSFVFENENIQVLAFDGGNRTWISTEEGLWVFNALFTEIDHFFTTENSPLPSNEIRQLTYNPENGEMFILTDKGLVSFRSSSSKGKENYDDVSIFPNPVRPGYSGLVGITGLQYDTKVKITTVDGKLIRELDTNGGTASWDLLDYDNQKVNSGIYILFTSTNDGQEKFVGKIAVVN